MLGVATPRRALPGALRALLGELPAAARAAPRAFASVAAAAGPLVLRPPTLDDVTATHSLVRASGLDVNSPYAYMLGADHWRDTSISAFRADLAADGDAGSSLVGMVHGYLVPARPSTYFVWQVATDERVRGCGYASDMIAFLLRKHARQSGVRYLEATVTRDNVASQRLFQGLGAKLGCPLEVTPALFPANRAVEPPTKDEDLYRVGPFAKESLDAYLADRQLMPPPGPPGSTESPAELRGECSLVVRNLADVEAAGNYKRGSRAKWESRRYLTRGDGFGFSFHHTVMYKDQASFQWYKNHTESVYITQGHGTIEIVQDGSPEDFERFIGTGVTYELSPGTMYALRGERHILTARSEGGMHCMCVFNPPVAGTEDHNERGVYPAVEDDGTPHYEYTDAEVPALFKPPEAFKGGSRWCK